jgi:hypothetical protein
MDKVAEILSSIQQQMQLLNPPKEAGEGLQLDFTAAAEEDPFSLGNSSPSLGFGMGMAASATATEKEVGASGLPGRDTNMSDVVSLVLLSPQNERDYCCGFIGRDRVCLMKIHLFDVAKHERGELSVVEPVLLILAPASKTTKFAAYREPSLPTSKLNQVQYETLLQERQDVAYWNRILTDVKGVRFDGEAEFQEVKTRTAKKSELGMAFTPSKKAKIPRDEIELEAELLIDTNPTDRARLSLVPIENAGQAFNLQGATWNTLVEYIDMLERRLPELQSMVSRTRDTSEARFANVEDELGLIGADLGQGGDVSGGHYTGLWSAVGTSLKENRALNRIITALGEQAKQVSVKAQQARQGASQASNDVVGMRSSMVELTNSELNSFLEFEDINTKLLQLASLLGHIQREVQGNVGTSVLHGPSEGAQVDGLPMEDYVRHMRQELDVFDSRIKAVTIGGITFESYDDTLKWVSQYCHKDDWKYVMDMPALYSLVKTDGLGKASSRVTVFSVQDSWFFSAKKTNKTDHWYREVATYDKWRSSGYKLGFRASVEDEIRRVEASTTSKNSVQHRNRPEALRLFLLMLKSVNQMFKFHQILDGQLLRYHEVLGPCSDDDNWLLRGNFWSAVLTGAYKPRLIWADAFSDKVDHVRVAFFLWACLQTHRVLQGYIDLEFIAHPEIGAVIFEHLIKTRTPMIMQSSLKSEILELRSQIKVLTSNYEKLESRLGHHENDIKNLKDKKWLKRKVVS